jgi:putative transposase
VLTFNRPGMQEVGRPPGLSGVLIPGAKNRLQPSMCRRGICWDNAVAESFVGTCKKEGITRRIYKNRDLATADVSDYIESFYNPTRRHSRLGGVSPEEFEVAAKQR